MARISFLLIGFWAVLVLGAQARQGSPLPAEPGAPQQSVSAPAPKPLVPAAASSIAANPAAFLGQNVTIMAAVDQIVSPTSFIVDQDAQKTAPGVLVMAAQLSAPVKVNSYLTVIGEVVQHEGQVAIRATAVIDSSMVDLARRLPPPMTADEEALDRLMKQIGPAFTAVREAIAAGTAGPARESAVTLKKGFTGTEPLWKKRGNADAMKWAADARLQSETLERSIASGVWDDAKAAASALQQTCSACHGVYRERQDDGTYRIR